MDLLKLDMNIDFFVNKDFSLFEFPFDLLNKGVWDKKERKKITRVWKPGATRLRDRDL